MTTVNTCMNCGRTLSRYDDEGSLVEHGEADCCCGDIDEDGNYGNASCIQCCPSMNGRQVWEGKSAGGGYYVVNPSY